jgi:hypothetical protein
MAESEKKSVGRMVSWDSSFKKVTEHSQVSDLRQQVLRQGRQDIEHGRRIFEMEQNFPKPRFFYLASSSLYFILQEGSTAGSEDGETVWRGSDRYGLLVAHCPGSAGDSCRGEQGTEYHGADFWGKSGEEWAVVLVAVQCSHLEACLNLDFVGWNFSMVTMVMRAKQQNLTLDRIT